MATQEGLLQRFNRPITRGPEPPPLGDLVDLQREAQKPDVRPPPAPPAPRRSNNAPNGDAISPRASNPGDDAKMEMEVDGDGKPPIVNGLGEITADQPSSAPPPSAE